MRRADDTGHRRTPIIIDYQPEPAATAEDIEQFVEKVLTDADFAANLIRESVLADRTGPKTPVPIIGKMN